MAETIAEELLVQIRLKTEALEEGMAEMRSILAKGSAQAEKLSVRQTATAKKAAREQVRAEQEAQTARITAIRAAEAEAKRAAEESARAAEEAAERAKAAQARLAAAAAAAFALIVKAVKEAVDAANEYNNAMVGLESLANGVGQDFGRLKAAAEELAADGLMPVSDAAAALKNLLARGFDAQEAIDLIKRLKDASAFGRQGQLSMGEAVRSATEGLKNENSVLVDNSGVTKNVSVMWSEYAAKIGKTTDKLTTAEKRQAEYAGIMQETAYQVGDAARYAEEFAGKQAALEAAQLRVNQAFGAAAQDALTPLVEAAAPLLDALTEFIERNPELVAGITGTAAAGTALTVVFMGWKVATLALAGAMGTLQASLGVIGAISLVVGAVAGLAVACENAKAPAEELADELDGLKREMQELGQSASGAEDALKVLEEASSTTEELTAAKRTLAQVLPQVVIGYDNEGNAILATNDIIRQQIGLMREKQRLALEEARAAAKEATETAKLNEEAAQIRMDNLRQQYEETEKYYDDMLAAAQNYSDEERALLEGYREDARQQNMQQQAEVAQEIADARLQTGLKLQEQYAIENQLLGEQDAAVQLAMQDTMELAAQQQLSAEEYLALLQETLNDEQQMAQYRAQAAQAAQEEADSIKVLTDEQSALNEAQSAAKTMQNARQLRAYVNEVKNGTKGTRTYKAAVEGLKKEYGDLFPSIEDSIDAIDGLVGAQEESAQKAVSAARTAIQNLMESQRAILAVSAASSQAAKEASSLLAVLAGLDAALAGLGTGALPSISVGGGGGGGGGGSSKSRWEKELDELEHYANLGEDVTRRQIDAIQRILKEEKLSTEKRWELEEQLYEKTNELLENKIDLYKSLTELTVEEASQQAAALTYMLQTYKLTAEERASLTEQLNETKKALDGDYLRDYIAHLNRILAEEKLNAAQRKNILNEIMQARISLMQKEREQMQEAIDARIEAIEDERDAQLKAIDEEIAALDELLQARKRAKQEEDDQDTLRRLQESLRYERDDYNRQQLEKQIEEKQKEIADRKFEEDIQDRKDALKAQQDAIRESADAEIKALQKMKEQRMNWYDEQLEMQQEYSEGSLEMQQLLNDTRAEKLDESNRILNQKTDEGQQRNVDTLLGYQGAMSGAGDTLGSSLETALSGHYDSVVSGANAMADAVVSAAQRAAAEIQALQAMTAAVVSAGAAGVSAVAGKNSITVTQNFNTPTATPSTIRSAGRKLAQDLLKR